MMSYETQLLNSCLLIIFAFYLDYGDTARNLTRYNVVLVMFDDMRPIIGGYGDKLAHTPHLDAFMKESAHFTRTYSQQSLCAPSRNSMLTSRRPDTLHLYDFYSYWRTFAGNYTTLPQYFKENGYYTYSVGKIFHPGISSNNSDDYPLSWTARPFHPKSEKFINSPVCQDGTGMLKKNLICPVDLQTQPLKTLPDIESTTEAIRFVQMREKIKKPFFLALGFHKPHINLRFPRQFLDYFTLQEFFNYTEDTYKPIDMPDVAWNPYTDVRARDDFKHKNISFPYGPISKLQSAQIRQGYYAAVSYVDDLFGKFIAHVNSSNTIVLVTSDHGWSLGEHAEWAKYSNFDVALRVPLIIRSPEFPMSEARRLHSLTELVDVFPTLVDLAHLPKIKKCSEINDGVGFSDSDVDTGVAGDGAGFVVDVGVADIQQKPRKICCTEGKSLYAQMEGIGLGEEYVALSQYPRPGMEPTKHPNSDKPKLKNIKIMGYTLRTNNYRYTLWVAFNAHNFTRDWTKIYGEEMYDHRLDANEEINLAERPEFDDTRIWLKHKLIKSFQK